MWRMDAISYILSNVLSPLLLVPVLPENIIVSDELELLVHVSDPVLTVHEVEREVSLVPQSNLPSLMMTR